MNRWIFPVIIAVFLLGSTSQLMASGGRNSIPEEELLQELKRMIEQQQAQLDRQAVEIATLKEQLGNTTEVAGSKADKAALANSEKMVSSSFSNVNVSLYGQLNPALLYANNGDSSKWYIVDNTHSQSRLGIKAKVDTSSGWVAGGRIEYGIVSNAGSDVNSQKTFNSTEETFKLRWAEVSFSHDSFGKISLGKGDSATNNTAEVDLSGTAVAMQDKTLWMASATLWYDGTINVLSDLKNKDIYNGYDGLSRTDRIRYDTPVFGGFSLAAAASSGDAHDGSLWYNREFNGTKVALGAGIANPGDVMPEANSLFTGSASILLPIGLSFTVSGGYKDFEEDARDSGEFLWGKLGYKTRFYDAATTAFSIDYGTSDNIKIDNTTGTTWALAAVHDISEWGSEFYAIYRMYTADTDDVDFDDIHSVMTGVRIKF